MKTNANGSWLVHESHTTLWQAGMFMLALVAALYFAADLLIPVAFAILFSLLLSPVVGWLTRRHVPATIAAGFLVAGLVAAIVFALGRFAEPANAWLEDAPKTVRELQYQITTAKSNLSNIQELAEEVDELAAQESPGKVQQVIVNGPGLVESLLGGLPSVISFIGIVVFLTFFLLASGDSLLRRMTSCGRSWTERRRIVSIARRIQSDLSRYLATVTTINAVLGIAVATVMQLLGVPNPLLWGVMAYLLNFAPYVGAMASAAVLTIVGVMTFDTASEALVVPAAFLCLTVIEGQLLTPTILGRQMSLSPMIVFLSVIFWGWLWGIAGALMAVPIVTSIKVVCDHIPGMQVVSNFLRNTPASPESSNVERNAQPAVIICDRMPERANIKRDAAV